MNYIKYIGVFVCLIIINTLNAQTIYTGKIIDIKGEALVGANIATDKEVIGVTTNDGTFNVALDKVPSYFSVSYIGYETLRLTPDQMIGDIVLAESNLELNQVVVSASRYEQARTEVPAAIGVLNARQIEETKATQIDQMVNQMTGVYMSNLGNESHTMSIRSPLSYKALFLFTQDGIPLRPTGNFSHTALKEMDNSSFERIEVIRGSNSSVYGSEAISGVINAITKRPSKSLSGKISAQGNNIGFKRTDLNLSNTFGKTGVFVGGHYGFTRDGWREHSDFDKLGSTINLTHKVSDKLNLALSANYISLNSDRTGNLDSLNFFGKNLSTLHTFTYTKTSAFRANATANYLWSDRANTKLIVFNRVLNSKGIPHFRIRKDRNDPTKARGEYRESGFKSIGAILNHSQYFDAMNTRLSVGASIDFSPETNMKRRLAIKRDTVGRYISYTEGNIFEDYQVDYSNTAVFAQLEFSPMKRLRIAAVARYDYFNYLYSSTEEFTITNGVVSDNESFYNITPKIGVTYDLGNNSGLYSNYSIGFVPPQIGLIYSKDRVVTTVAPERYHNVELGAWATLLQGNLYLDAALYRLKGANEIVSVLQEDGSEEYANAGATLHTGLELGAQANIYEGLSFRLNGTYAHHTYDTFKDGENDYSGNFMSRSPKLIFNTGLIYRPTFLKGFRIGLDWQHLGEYFQSDKNDETKVYPGFDLLHLRTGYKMNNGLELWVNVLNLTDKLYAEISDVSAYSGAKRYRPGNPRNFNVGIQYNFGK